MDGWMMDGSIIKAIKRDMCIYSICCLALNIWIQKWQRSFGALRLKTLANIPCRSFSDKTGTGDLNGLHFQDSSRPNRYLSVYPLVMEHMETHH